MSPDHKYAFEFPSGGPWGGVPGDRLIHEATAVLDLLREFFAP